MIGLFAAAVIAVVASPGPSASPASTVYLSYNAPKQGYQSHTTATVGTNNLTIDQRIDAYSDREADISFNMNGRTLNEHFLIMDGLVYERSNGTWTLPTPLPPTVALLVFGTYEPSSNYDVPGRTVTNSGSGPCGASTCDLYTASRPGKLNDKPIVTISHLAIDPATRFLIVNDATSFDAAGNKNAQFTATYSGFDGQRLTIPQMTIASTAPDQCVKGDSSSGAVQVCLRRCTCSNDIYSVSVGDTLVMRASADAAGTRTLTSPVIDNLTLSCNKTMAAQNVDPKLVAQLKASGMTDAQIQANLGQRQTASDCTVTIGGRSALAAHFDFK